MTISQFFLWSLLKIIVVTVVLLMGVAYTVLLERKLVGRIQNRWGPSRVGPFGLLQPLVDGAKSFLKEDIIPSAVYRPLYLLAPILSLGCALISTRRLACTGLRCRDGRRITSIRCLARFVLRRSLSATSLRWDFRWWAW